ncbi:T9SS type A sorting domain-containing protein [Pontibacter sp. G13]|uniref:T9SS type A sorting domain-containing protein n=1 Tax=Pontibacter sp. G13 TaxID=3074898 RepID=UPI0028899813|nr:T9SS type A sorting domain-containing protein [Pontibacter sp. G13]WNJ20868.1 T9SS type A sorting domain-containing protein [Pontibacter sp. G13]
MFIHNPFTDKFGPRTGRQLLLVLILITYLPISLSAQCLTPAAVGSCAGGNGRATNGQNIKSNETYWFDKTETFSSGLTMNGGTLRICGNLTLSSIKFKSGTIVVEEGGTLTINGNGTLNLNGSSHISNRGTLHMNRSVNMQNHNNTIVNAETGVFYMNKSTYRLKLLNETAFFTNLGTAYIHSLIIEGSAGEGAVCIGGGSTIEMQALTNNEPNGVEAPSGVGCMQFTGSAQLNEPLTSNTNLSICQGSGTTLSGGSGFGSAVVQTNCTTCGKTLPIELGYFDAQLEGSEVAIEWTTVSELNNDRFEIERSMDGGNWEIMGEIAGAGTTSEPQVYAYRDAQPEIGTAYYRIKQIDFNGQFSYSDVVSVNIHSISHTRLVAYPNPTSDMLWLRNAQGTANDVSIYTISGARVRNILPTHQIDAETIKMDLSQLPAGVYLVKVGTEVQKVIKW